MRIFANDVKRTVIDMSEVTDAHVFNNHTIILVGDDEIRTLSYDDEDKRLLDCEVLKLAISKARSQRWDEKYKSMTDDMYYAY